MSQVRKKHRIYESGYISCKSKAVTMNYFFLKGNESCRIKFYRFIFMIENKIFRQNLLEVHFHHQNLRFLKNNKITLTVERLMAHLFCLRCFYVYFWPKQIFAGNFFLYYLLPSIWIYKLLFSRIAENSSHCYTLSIRKNIWLPN